MRHAQLAQAKENLARVSEEVEVRVHTAYNKLERTRQMGAVSEELLALRGESRQVAAEQLRRGAVLGSTAGASVAQDLEAKALLLQSRLDYVQATAEMDEAIGRTPQLECFAADVIAQPSSEETPLLHSEWLLGSSISPLLTTRPKCI
jgi:outer membrane protein TolC